MSLRAFLKLGFSRQKTNSFRELSSNLVAPHLDLDTLMNCKNKDAINYLFGLRGVGGWTAEYVLLWALGRFDVLPGHGFGAQNRLAMWLRRSGPMNYISPRWGLKCWQPYAGLIYFITLMESLAAAGTAGRSKGRLRQRLDCSALLPVLVGLQNLIDFITASITCLRSSALLHPRAEPR